MIRRILVFEDDQDLQGLLVRFLTGRGYDVLAFDTPGAFCDQYCGTCADCACGDVVLSDVRMPDINGLDFVRRLQRSGCPIAKFGLMSGAWNQPELDKAANLGCRIFRKPFSLSEVDHWLSAPARDATPARHFS